MSDEQSTPRDEDKFYHRTRMAWYGAAGASGTALAVVLAGIWMDAESIEAARPMMQSSIWAHIALPVVYILGLAGIEALARLRHG